MLYEVAGKKPAMRRAGDKRKESQLATLKEIFDQVLLPVPLDVAIEYVRRVSYKMRQYSDIDNQDGDDDWITIYATFFLVKTWI